jgi:hypothetical protein
METRADDTFYDLVQACERLLFKSHFQRLWTWQELILSNELLLACGWYSTTSQRLQASLDRLSLPCTVGIVLKSALQADINYSLLDALSKFGSYQCTEPRDHVFAMLSILHPEDRSLLTALPDYSLSITAVTVVTLKHIRQTSGQHQPCTNVTAVLLALGASHWTVSTTSMLSQAVYDVGQDLHKEARRRRSGRHSASEDMRTIVVSLTKVSSDGDVHEKIAEQYLRLRVPLSKRFVPVLGLTELDIVDCVFGDPTDASASWRLD